MRVMSIYEAATFLGCSSRWIHNLLQQEFISSLCVDELAVYQEKRKVIHDEYIKLELETHYHV